MEFFSYLLPETPEGLAQLDLALHIIHSGLVLFVVFGVFFKKLIKLHFLTLAVIWASWLGIGLYLGHVGYCLLTDWHWQVKYRQGEVELPSSYIEYWYNYFAGRDIDDALMANITAGVMIVITLVSGYRFFKNIRVHRRTG